MIPVENSLAGRVSDIYHLLPEGGLHIIEENFLPIHHQLMGVKGAKFEDIIVARSHAMALGQVRKRLLSMGIAPVEDLDTAGAANKVALRGDKTIAAIASTLAAELYGLEILAKDIEDEQHNTTRFLTSMRSRNCPAAQRKALYENFVCDGRAIVERFDSAGRVCRQRSDLHVLAQ